MLRQPHVRLDVLRIETEDGLSQASPFLGDLGLVHVLFEI